MKQNPYPTQPGFDLRVRNAAKAIRMLAVDPFAGIYTRKFDNCFEMDDGDAVVWALMDQATSEPDQFGQSLLTEGIQRMFSSTLEGRKFPEFWLEVYQRHEQLELFQ